MSFLFRRTLAALCVFQLLLAGAVFAADETAALLTKKLDEVLANQKQIMKTLEELKQEIYVVKIRSTR